MDREVLDIIAYTDKGYKPLIDFNGWRVAYLRYLDGLFPPKIDKLERHMQTDEVFVLIGGQATLVMGGNKSFVDSLETVCMQPRQLYNVRKGAWHGVVLSRDATILLVENTNTCEANSEYFDLTPAMQTQIVDAACKMADWADLKN
jgi:ureidoglycolate hydrolase